MYGFLNQLTEPFTFLVLGLWVTTVWSWRSKPRGRPLVVGTILLALLTLLSTPIVGDLALASLERSYPPSVEVPTRNDTIVVLSANLATTEDSDGKIRLGRESLLRCYHAARLYHDSGGCLVILSGGSIDPRWPRATLADAMRDFMLEMGVRGDDLLMEEKSTTTYENARFCKPLLERREAGRIWLVTEAAHIYRAKGCFSALGIPIVPAPCGHHAWQTQTTLASFLPSSHGASAMSRAAHEWVGCLWYRLNGRT